MCKTNDDKMRISINKLLASLVKKEATHPDGMAKTSLLSCDYCKKTAVFQYPVQEWQLNFTGVMHGGITCLLFDNALGLLANYFCPNFVPTANLNVNFIKAIPAGEFLIITAKITSQGKRLITLTGEAVLESSNVLAATAMATFAVTNIPKSF